MMLAEGEEGFEYGMLKKMRECYRLVAEGDSDEVSYDGDTGVQAGGCWQESRE